MLFRGLIATNLSGSMEGITASHNRGGAYFRDRAIPVQPNTLQQAIMKAIFGALTTRWRDTLTNAQRDEWDTYALNTPLTNAIGDPFTPTGLNMYIRGNAPRVQAAKTIVDDGPSTFGLPTLSAVTLVSATAAGGTASLAFDNTDPWANEDDAWLCSYGSRPFSPTHNFFKGPFRFAKALEGDSVTPPTSPDTITMPFPFAAGQQLGLRVAVVDAQARKSPDQIHRVIASA